MPYRRLGFLLLEAVGLLVTGHARNAERGR